MLASQESALETCQRIQTILREVEQAVLIPGTDMLAQWETELGEAAALLEGIHESMNNRAAAGDSATRAALAANPAAWAARCKPSSNMDRITAWACCKCVWERAIPEQGLPVLMPTEARGTFEG